MSKSIRCLGGEELSTERCEFFDCKYNDGKGICIGRDGNARVIEKSIDKEDVSI